MSVVAVVPARGGSKAIPGKNLVQCGDRPLIGWTFEAAKGSRLLDQVILSTDDEKIASYARECGIEVPYSRDPRLASDEAHMLPVLLEALDWFERAGTSPEAVVLLQPTSPLRTSRHLDEAIESFYKNGADTLVSVVKVPHAFNPVSVLRRSEDGSLSAFIEGQSAILRRQDKPEVFARNGPAILILKPFVLRSGRLYGDRTIGYEMEMRDSIDIDDWYDLAAAEAEIRRRTEKS